MKQIQFAMASGVVLLLLGCSKSVESTGSVAAVVSGPQVEVVHLPGSSPPVLIRIAQPGVAGEGCANNDGPAVQFDFKVENELPTVFVKDESLTKLTLMFGPPLAGNQELHIRVNTTLAKVRALKEWTIESPDADGGLLAWVCPADGYPCDFATTGSVTFTEANDQFIEAHANLLFQSKNTVQTRFSAKYVPSARPVMCG
ncbi:MAG TPA: hypothetical protein VGM81_01695 [Burkholderiaceae bacterium]|jgi:hypothetical protein